MARYKDITGQTFGMLTAVRKNGVDRTGNVRWDFVCACGATKNKRASGVKKAVKHGYVPSCGCASVMGGNRSHGMSYHPAYFAWREMKDRCRRPAREDWARYGGRGITVCAAWEDFEQFWADMGATWQKGLSLDRINNDQGYSPENCRWATASEQARNRRTNVIVSTPWGHMTVAEASERSGVPLSAIRDRLKRGWDHMTAVCEPADKRGRYKNGVYTLSRYSK